MEKKMSNNHCFTKLKEIEIQSPNASPKWSVERNFVNGKRGIERGGEKRTRQVRYLFSWRSSYASTSGNAIILITR